MDSELVLVQWLTQLQWLIVVTVVVSFTVVHAADFWGKPRVPAALERISQRIVQGKVPTNVSNILKAKVPGYMEHYRRVPGRMSCRVTPHEVNGEGVYALVIGFKETAATPAHQYISVPVYKNGNLYEH